MERAPKWFVPVAIVALLWNLLGCMAYLADVMMSAESLANLTAEQQAMYAARPAWSVAATAIAVWFGSLGCVGLIMRKAWAMPLLLLSLLGVIAQDLSLFMLGNAAEAFAPAALALQGVVLVISIALVLLARRAASAGWIGAGAK